MAKAAETVQLKEETLLAFTDYVRQAEAAMEPVLNGEGLFLWSDTSAEAAEHLRRGNAFAERWSGEWPAAVPDGLVHDWIGAIHIPGTTVEKTLLLLQDYDNHKEIYRPEVVDSRLISRAGDDFKISLRLLKKKIVTVVLDTDHDVHYASLDALRRHCRSYTTRVAEVEDAGKPTETVHPPDTGHGYLWRLYSYWRFQEKEGGVSVECRAISLTRAVPKALAWIVGPVVKKLPRESLIATLAATGRALCAGGGDVTPAS
jgi:hypothetical protein